MRLVCEESSLLCQEGVKGFLIIGPLCSLCENPHSSFRCPEEKIRPGSDDKIMSISDCEEGSPLCQLRCLRAFKHPTHHLHPFSQVLSALCCWAKIQHFHH